MMNGPDAIIRIGTPVVNSLIASNISLILKKEERKNIKMIEKKTEIEEESIEDIHLKTIEELTAKMNEEMISKEDYQKLQEQYKNLMKEFTTRRPIEEVKPVEVRKPVEIAKEIIDIKGNDITNREYIEKALEYRNSVLKTTGKDVFTDFGAHGPSEPTENSVKVASFFEKLLKDHDDPTSFRIAYDANVKDDPVLVNLLARRKK